MTRGRAVSDGRYREPLHDISLDRCIAHVDGAGATFLDYARAENDTEAETEAAESAGRAKALIRGFVSTLRDPRDVAIVRLRLLGDPPATLEEIGRQFGVSRERIRQMQARVLERLKSYALARKDRDLAPLPRRPPVAPTPRPPRVWQTPYCTESDCERPSWARNLCVGHYKQWWIARRKVA